MLVALRPIAITSIITLFLQDGLTGTAGGAQALFKASSLRASEDVSGGQDPLAPGNLGASRQTVASWPSGWRQQWPRWRGSSGPCRRPAAAESGYCEQLLRWLRQLPKWCGSSRDGGGSFRSGGGGSRDGSGSCQMAAAAAEEAAAAAEEAAAAAKVAAAAAG